MDAYTPKYVVVQNFILEKIKSGVLRRGDKIPSENDLASMFKISRVTVNYAISQLRTQGVVDRIQGKGTFVKGPDAFLGQAVNTNLQSFKISSQLHTDDHRFLKSEIITVDSKDTVKLLLLPGERYHKITRLMHTQDKTIAVDYSYFPHAFFPHEIEKALIEKLYLHVFLQTHCGQSPKRLHTHIDILTAPDEIHQQHLDAHSTEPLLLWNTMVIDACDVVLGYTETCARPSVFQPYLNLML